MPATPAIGPAAPGDLPAILALLKRAKLPPDGLAPHLDTTLVLRQGNAIVGSAALECYGDAALLRSVAVDASLRGQGWGVRLTEAALALAEHDGATAVYLLTETAEHFFPRFGFTAIARDAVPAAVRSSIEFTTACCSTAVCMVRQAPATTPARGTM